MNLRDTAEPRREALSLLTVALAALRDNLRDALQRTEDACSSAQLNEPCIAIGALSGVDQLLTEAQALHRAGLAIHRRERAPAAARSASQTSYAQQAQREIDELAKLGVIAAIRAPILKAQLTEDVIQQHLDAGMSIGELIDMYNDLAAAEPVSTQSPSNARETDSDLRAELSRFVQAQGLEDGGDAMELLHRQDLTSEQRRWLSAFMRRWEAMRRETEPGAGNPGLTSQGPPFEAMPPYITEWHALLEIKDAAGALLGHLPRYAVWRWDATRQRHQCIDTGDDLEDLTHRYNVSPEHVVSAPRIKD